MIFGRNFISVLFIFMWYDKCGGVWVDTRYLRTYFTSVRRVVLVETGVLQTVLWDIRAWSARFQVIDCKMINDISRESAWHSLHTDVIVAYFFIYMQNFRNILLVMLPKYLLLLCYQHYNYNWCIMCRYFTLMGHFL